MRSSSMRRLEDLSDLDSEEREFFERLAGTLWRAKRDGAVAGLLYGAGVFGCGLFAWVLRYDAAAIFLLAILGGFVLDLRRRLFVALR